MFYTSRTDPVTDVQKAQTQAGFKTLALITVMAEFLIFKHLPVRHFSTFSRDVVFQSFPNSSILTMSLSVFFYAVVFEGLKVMSLRCWLLNSIFPVPFVTFGAIFTCDEVPQNLLNGFTRAVFYREENVGSSSLAHDTVILHHYSDRLLHMNLLTSTTVTFWSFSPLS